MDNPHKPVISDEADDRILWLKNRARGHKVYIEAIRSNGYGRRELQSFCRYCGKRLLSVSMEEIGHASATCRYSEV